MTTHARREFTVRKAVLWMVGSINNESLNARTGTWVSDVITSSRSCQARRWKPLPCNAIDAARRCCATTWRAPSHNRRPRRRAFQVRQSIRNVIKVIQPIPHPSPLEYSQSSNQTFRSSWVAAFPAELSWPPGMLSSRFTRWAQAMFGKHSVLCLWLAHEPVSSIKREDP